MKKKIVESNRVHKIKRTGRSLKEQVCDEAYYLADYIDRYAEMRMEDLPNGDEVLRRADFDDLFWNGCKDVFGLDTEEKEDAFIDGDLLKDKYKDHPYSGADDANELEMTVRGILGYKGYDTIFETDDEKCYEEGDLVVHNWDNEKVEESVISRARSGKLNLKENKITRISAGVKYSVPNKKVAIKEGKETEKGYWLDEDEYNAIDKLSTAMKLEDSFMLGNYGKGYNQEVKGDSWWDFDNKKRVSFKTGLHWFYEALYPEIIDETLNAKEKRALFKLLENFGYDTSAYKKNRNESVRRVNLRNLEKLFK